jgi:pyruvate,water dikinase
VDVDKIWVIDDEPSTERPDWTRGNVGEVFPEVVSPITWSSLGARAEDGWRDAFVTFGALAHADYEADVRNLLGVFGGYCYLNLTTNRLFAARTPGISPADIDRLLFGEMEDAPIWKPPAGARNLGRTGRAIRSLLGILGAKSTPEVDDDITKVDRWLASQPDLATASDADILATIKRYEPLFQELFARHILTSFKTSVSTSVLEQLLAKHAGGEVGVTTLIGGLGGVVSAAPASRLWTLGRDVAEAAVLTAMFDAGPDGLEERLRSSTETEVVAFVTAFDRFLAAHGCRGPNEWELASEVWGVRPGLALAAIDRLRHADADHDPEIAAVRLEHDRYEATGIAEAAMPWRARGRFAKAVRAAQVFARAREQTKTTVIRSVHSMRLAHRELARRGRERGGPDDLGQYFLLDIAEVPDYLDAPAPWREKLAARAAQRDRLRALVPPFVFSGTVPPIDTWTRRDQATEDVVAGTALQGIGACPGVARGRARVVLDPFDPKGLGPGDVLIAPLTDPSWTPLFLSAEAVVVDVGALMSHAVIVSRELGIPCVVSVTGATTTIPEGAEIEVDGTTGTVRVL